jgi:hypothetical protein
LSQYDNTYSEGQHKGGLAFARSFADFKDMPGSTINTVERVVSAFPQPKKRPVQTTKAKPKEAVVGDVAAGTGSIGAGTGTAPVVRPKTSVAAAGSNAKALAELLKKQLEAIPPIPETYHTAVKATVSWNNY